MTRFNRCSKPWMAFTLSVLLLVATPSLMLAESQEFNLEEGTPVRLKFLDTVSSGRNQAGDSIGFRVADDVYAEDGQTVLIKEGTPAWGTVSSVQSRGRVGRKGELGIMVEATRSVQGKRVPLRASLNRDGRDKLGTTVALGLIVTPLFLLMRGKDATISAGTPIQAYVDRDMQVQAAPPEQSRTTRTSNTPAEKGVQANAGGKKEIPEYLKKYADEDDLKRQEALEALTRLQEQGLLSQEEYDAKRKQLMAD